ncbi:MAG: hypothetical protein AAF755_01210 [Pseudomonadota bacterium]
MAETLILTALTISADFAENGPDFDEGAGRALLKYADDPKYMPDGVGFSCPNRLLGLVKAMDQIGVKLSKRTGGITVLHLPSFEYRRTEREQL